MAFGFPSFNDETAHVVAVSSKPSCQCQPARQELVMAASAKGIPLKLAFGSVSLP